MRDGSWPVSGHSTAPHKPWPPFTRLPLQISTTSLSGSTQFQSAGPGYDLATGRGSPVANLLIPYLASYGSTSSTGGGTTTTVTAPAAPSNFAAQAISTTQISLSWSASSGATGYNVYELENGQAVLIGSLGSGATSFTVGSLSAGTTYSFEVAAFNSAGSTATGWVQATTPALTATVTAPTGVNATATSSTSRARFMERDGWRDRLYRLRMERCASGASGQRAAPPQPRRISAASLRARQSISMSTAYNATSSASSGWVSVVMPASAAIAPPTNLVASATSTTTGTLSWAPSAGATGYAIYYWNGFQAVLLGTVGSGTTSVTIQGLAAGSTTYFAVVAYNNTSSAASNWVGLTTPVSSAATAADIFAQSVSKNQYSWLD